MPKKPPTNNYAFIDSQNLNLGIRSMGWELDFRKFRLYLKNKYQVDKAYLFIGHIADNQSLYDNLTSMGYTLVFKRTTQYKVGGKVTFKGNVDAELVLYASAKVYTKYNKAVIISGDGDFACLAEYLLEKGKLLRIITPNKKYSQLLSDYREHITHLEQLKPKLSYKKTDSKKPIHAVGRNLRQNRRISRKKRSVETLGSPRNGDLLNNIPKNAKTFNKPKR